VNFGLVNQTYANDCGASVNLTQWQRFNHVLYALNQESVENVVYKLLFIGRHGEGYHNAEQTYVGTPAWNVSHSLFELYTADEASVTGLNSMGTPPPHGPMQH